MMYSIDCKANITAQDANYPTYKKIDCDLHINANDDGFYGRLIDCIGAITNVIVTACKSWDQGIRLKILIDDVNVSEAIIGNLIIQHDKNKISTFNFSLGDTQYSPRTNSHIDLEKEVVITAYINGEEKKLFTGLLDEPEAENTPAFKVIITGRDYGKKLLSKRTTLISIQDLAASNKRNDLIKYLAEQAGITSVDIPEMDLVTIDNSFQHQSIWDMVQKEAMVGQYWVKHDEDGIMHLKLNEIKSDTSLYPTPDWSYDEDRIIRLGYKRSRVNINKIIVLGQTIQSRIPVIEEIGDILAYYKSWTASDGTLAIEGTEISGDFTIKTEFDQYLFVWNVGQGDKYRIKITWSDNDYEITRFHHHGHNITPYYKVKKANYLKLLFLKNPYTAGSITIILEGRKRDIIYETRYDQISAEVTDPNSIEKYGERDGGSIVYPLLETVEQCIAVGSKIIRDSHRVGQTTSFLIPFNPLIQVGQTIAIINKKIGMDERYYVESIQQNIDTIEGKIKARTQIGGVYYT